MLAAGTPLAGQDAADSTPQVAGFWGVSRQDDHGAHWLLLTLHRDSTFAMMRVYADSEGVHRVAGWVEPVVGRYRVQSVMGDIVLCFQRDPRQAVGTLNPPIFNGAHCSPVETRRLGAARVLMLGDLTLMPVKWPDPADPSPPLQDS